MQNIAFEKLKVSKALPTLRGKYLMGASEKIIKAAEDFANQVIDDTEDFLFKEAMLKCAIRESIWALYYKAPDQKYAITEMLEIMFTVIKEHENEPQTINNPQ